MSENISISAVIPTYNREKTIGRAVDSVLSQEHPPVEIIVIDDGSEDDTRKVLESYDKRIRYVHQVNKGVSAARNRGVSEANAEWIAFLDSDDYWLPYHLSNIVSAIKDTNGLASLYFSDTMRPQEKGGNSLWDFCKFYVPGPFLIKNDASKWAFMSFQPMMLQSSVICKRSFYEVGGLPENMLTREDTFLFYKLAMQYPVCAVSGCGTIMTSDGKQRLTQLYDGYNLVFLKSTVLLYRLLLHDEKLIQKRYRKILNNKLSNSYFSLGRYYWRSNDFMIMLRNLLVAAWISPGSFSKQILDKLAYHAPNSNHAVEKQRSYMHSRERRE